MIAVVDVKVPPNAGLTRGNHKSHDFAMLILEKPAVYSKQVRPICLPPPHAEYGGKFAAAAGKYSAIKSMKKFNINL